MKMMFYAIGTIIIASLLGGLFGLLPRMMMAALLMLLSFPPTSVRS